MEPKRLILVPQLRIAMRYQSWWPKEFDEQLSDRYDQIIALGSDKEHSTGDHDFTVMEASIKNELRQVRQFMELELTCNDTLLHFDLSFPGIFHSALFHKSPAKSAVICHATALNRYDLFQPVRTDKWRVERTHANLYDKVFVATKYHADKLNLSNVVVLGSLPGTPGWAFPPSSGEPRTNLFCSVSRPSNQKTDMTVESAVRQLSGEKINRRRFRTWKGYYQFLDRHKFLLITSKEETYGLQAMDAMSRGCIPIAPRAYSYPELIPDDLLYNPDVGPEEKAAQIMWIVEKQKDRNGIVPLNDTEIENFWNTFGDSLDG